MSNPEMEKPTEEQEKRLTNAMTQMQTTVISIEKISDLIGDLRRELNAAAILLSQVRNVIGPQAYRYNSPTRWVEDIDKRVEAIEAMLK